MATMNAHNKTYLGRPTIVSIVLTNLYSRGSMTVEQLRRIASVDHPAVGKQAIYSTLERLRDRGEVTKISNGHDMHHILTVKGAASARKLIPTANRLVMDAPPKLDVRPMLPLPNPKPEPKKPEPPKIDPAKVKLVRAKAPLSIVATKPDPVASVQVPDLRVTQAAITPSGDIEIKLTLSFNANGAK